MGNEYLFGIGGVALGLGGMYLLIRQGIIPNPSPVAPVTARASAPMRRSFARPRPMTNQNNAFTGKFGRKSFNGKVVASNIPTRHARAGILANAQSFSDPAHSGLIRIN